MPTSPPSPAPDPRQAAPPLSVPPLSLDEVRRIARLLHEADLSEIEIETLAPTTSSNSSEDGAPAPRVRLQLRRGTEPSVVRRARSAAAATPGSPASTSAGGSASASTDASTAGEGGSGTRDVLSPTVGVFRALQPPLQVGDEVQAGQKAGAVEALKIPSDILFVHAGRISAILAEDGSGVEYAQPLFQLEPSPLTTDAR